MCVFLSGGTIIVLNLELMVWSLLEISTTVATFTLAFDALTTRTVLGATRLGVLAQRRPGQRS